MALSLRGMTLELWIIVAYLVVATVGDLNAAKLKVQVGSVPIFLTDITLILLLIVSFVRWPARVLYWGTEGVGAGIIGRAAWILCFLAIIYFAFAFPEYHLYAMRDLAIFGYALFFPLTWFAIRDRDDAAKLVRYLTYSGVILALIMLFQGSIRGFGGHWDYSTKGPAALPSGPLKRVVLDLINQDAGAFTVFALAALPAYMIFESRLRYFHTICAIACFFALAASTSRAGVVGLSVAFGITLLYAGPRYRARCALFGTFFVLAVALAPMLPRTMPGSRPLSNLRLAVLGAARGPSGDPTSQFRIIRWQYTFKRWMSHPILGEGFGSTIIPYSLWETNERMGLFNRGMPHNTFLFVADRMGIVGLGLVLFCWCLIVGRLLGAMRRTRRAADLAAANILAAMFGFAMFVLFFERPVTNAAFWIVMAAGARLVEGQTGAPTRTGKRTAWSPSS